MKMKIEVQDRETVQWVSYECPGCKHRHSVPAERWHWNGSVDKPTLSPSVKHYIPQSEYGPEKTICHYLVRAGNIEFCGDCEHELSGQTVELPDIIDVKNH